MRKMGWGLISVAALMVAGSQVADAAATCKMVRSWCAKSLVVTNDNNDNKKDNDRAPTSVPEPEMLALMGAGVAAMGVAALRRRKNKKG